MQYTVWVCTVRVAASREAGEKLTASEKQANKQTKWPPFEVSFLLSVDIVVARCISSSFVYFDSS